MKLFSCITSFLLAASAIRDSSYNKALQFPREASFDHYVIFKPDFSEVQDEISICSWVKFYRTDGHRNWFSYAVEQNLNMIMLGCRPQYFAAFLAKPLPSNSNLNFSPYLWQHQCLIWDAVSEHVELFLNGKRATGDVTPSGSRLSAGGTLVLGLEQDCVGGCWEKGEEFGGEIYGLQILKRRLTPAEIKEMHDAGMCDRAASVPGVVIAWEDFLGAERHGNVREISAGCSVWDRLNDFVGQVVSPALITYLEGGSQGEDKGSAKPSKGKKKRGDKKSATGSRSDWGKILEYFIDQKISEQLISHLKRHHQF